MNNHTRNVFRRIARFCIPILALLMFAKLSPAVMTILADQSAQRGEIAQAQSRAAEHYLSILLN
ncbi:MAG: hypothetical protein E5V49_09995 [Mesorhizobium sp.]|nr:hypothetical protein EN848_30785 [bacterium M00.F.Ca.ET.205.01.1.1]TGU55177.1 hypothetical protein EN795_00075 [bacterium M00.F.Ca.ET.152.01.1.1]TGV40526.1 hypothetical protein EN829_004365 [Mesorhizobium sp. M00.F.Ca.ET.186.01.1.1]TGZ45530.1 hypothetical protein EN805_04345 [bacterium M00.F.Ca.ET.162.01.1.1]TIW61745.1 MAG: hypothetical protein E5V48_07990 [Mesorhizobium sp.]